MYKERQRILPSLVSTLEACQTCWALSSSHFVFSVSLYSLLARISGLKETLLLLFWFSPAIFFDLGRKIIENAAMFKNFEKGKDIFENFRVIGWSISFTVLISQSVVLVFEPIRIEHYILSNTARGYSPKTTNYSTYDYSLIIFSHLHLHLLQKHSLTLIYISTTTFRATFISRIWNRNFILGILTNQRFSR